jgi:hypothetical protein
MFEEDRAKMGSREGKLETKRSILRKHFEEVKQREVAEAKPTEEEAPKRKGMFTMSKGDKYYSKGHFSSRLSHLE